MPAPTSGPIIGSYQIGRTVGKGSFGKVKEAVFLPSGETVAIKIINRQMLTNNTGVDAKIAREIKILKLFRHNNICRLYDVITTPTDILVVMEYIKGKELYDVIVERGKLGENDARYIFQQLICAVEYWHHYRVVHRDLKPENILLEPDLTVKVIDFGLANLMKDGVFLRTSCGSPNYAAPEVISGRLYVGPEIDIWSSGVILYALLCGCLPFDEDTIPQLFKKIKAGEYRIPSHVGPEARDLLKRMLVVDPLDRITLPQLRDHAWFAASLPRYLHYRPNAFENAGNIDISLAPAVAQVMKVSVAEVAAALERRDSPTLTKLQNTIVVAYGILADARRRHEIEELRKLDQSESGSASTQRNGVTASQRELNQGLMLTTSPVVDALLNAGRAAGIKESYNSQSFVPPSMQDSRAFSTGSLRVAASPGTFCFAGNPSSFQERVGSLHSTYLAASAPKRADSGVGNQFPTTQIPSTSSTPHVPPNSMATTASIGPTHMVGSVAKPNAVYDPGESAVAHENNVGWRVGLMTALGSAHVISETFLVLRELQMEWKIESPFVINARFAADTATVVQLQLLRLGDKHDQGYVVDFLFIKGNALLALETSARIGERLIRRIG